MSIPFILVALTIPTRCLYASHPNCAASFPNNSSAKLLDITPIPLMSQISFALAFMFSRLMIFVLTSNPDLRLPHDSASSPIETFNVSSSCSYFISIMSTIWCLPSANDNARSNNSGLVKLIAHTTIVPRNSQGSCLTWTSPLRVHNKMGGSSIYMKRSSANSCDLVCSKETVTLSKFRVSRHPLFDALLQCKFIRPLFVFYRAK